MPPWKAVGPSGGRKVSDLCCLGVWPVLVSLRSVSGIKSHKGGDSALALRGVAPGLGVRGPAHPLVVEDRVAPDLVRHDHSLESVGLKQKMFICLLEPIETYRSSSNWNSSGE